MKITKVTLLLCGIVLLAFLLRISLITSNPPGLYIDEVSIGLNAYNILETGKDQYGTAYPLAFKSFGDYKMPVYIYLVSGSMAVFGKNELAIRFPAVFFGTLTVLAIFFLTRELLKPDKKLKKYVTTLALGSALLFTILPWHLQFSRGGFEVCVALCFYSFGLLFGIRYWKTKVLGYLLGSVFLFSLSMYTYHSYRILVPITVFTIIGISLWKKKQVKEILLAAGVFLLISMPLILFSLTSQGQERLMQTSAFSGGLAIQSLLKDVFIFFNNYFSFFSLTYLFHYGDQINRHQVQNFGLLYMWQLPFILAGIYYVIKTKNTLLRFIVFFLLLVGPVAPSFALPSPHTLRFLLGSVYFTLLTIFGIYQLFSIAKKVYIKWMIVGLIVTSFIGFGYFLDYYFIHYPRESQIDWGGRCKEITSVVKEYAPHYDSIIIDKNLLCIPEYFTFYTPTIPVKYVPVSWKKPVNQPDKKFLYVRPYYGNPKPEKLLRNIYLLNNQKDIFAQIYKL